MFILGINKQKRIFYINCLRSDIPVTSTLKEKYTATYTDYYLIVLT